MSNRFHKITPPQTPEQFVDEAEALPYATSTPNTSYPWDVGRPDVLKSFNLRLPEPILFQLRYIGEHTPYSMQQFCIEHLTTAIQEKIAVVLSRVSPNVMVAAETRDAREFLQEYEHFRVCETEIRERAIFRRAVAQGKGIVEMKPQDPKATNEIRLLYQEIFDE